MDKISENISAKTIFHFTTKMDYLLQILENNFRPRYCLEDVSWRRNFDILGMDQKAYPMVCFCDIPLSKIKIHLKTYGSYGIGLKKAWGYNKSLTPIIYSKSNTQTSKAMDNLISYYNKNNKPLELKYIISKLNMYIKPCAGKMWRKNLYEQANFYDEREWRWIPEITSTQFKEFLDFDEYFDDEFREGENRKIGRSFSLDFKPSDIKYLIVKNESEREEFIGQLERIKSKYDPLTIKLLSSRIISSNQIKHDF